MQISGWQFIVFIFIVSFMTLVGWYIFFVAIKKSNENVKDVLADNAFLENLIVVGVVIAITALGSIGIIKGELCATILSGIVGYVLGSKKLKYFEKSDKKQE